MTAVLAFSLLPEFRLPYDDRLELGCRAAFTHRAAVARWVDGATVRGGEWLVTEGVPKRSGWRPPISPDIDAHPDDIAFGMAADSFYSRRRGRANKTVIVWPEDGEAVVVGLVRRGIGESYKASGSSGMFDDTFEPGGFAAEGFVHLYALRRDLSGPLTDYLLVPHWAITPAL